MPHSHMKPIQHGGGWSRLHNPRITLPSKELQQQENREHLEGFGDDPSSAPGRAAGYPSNAMQIDRLDTDISFVCPSRRGYTIDRS